MNKVSRVRVVGKKTFGPKIDIADPCYDRNVWCRKNDVPIKEGEYFCIISEAVASDVKGKPYTYATVEKIAISLSGDFPKESDMKYLGEIGVDAGLAGFFSNKPDYDDSEWNSLSHRLDHEDNNAWIFDEGYFSLSGHGDGCYPVFVSRNENCEIVALVIDFLVR